MALSCFIHNFAAACAAAPTAPTTSSSAAIARCLSWLAWCRQPCLCCDVRALGSNSTCLGKQGCPRAGRAGRPSYLHCRLNCCLKDEVLLPSHTTPGSARCLG
ncbi:hypothetical protein V8C86DRAFT_1219288 [Haematococcus lacustris]